MPIIAVRRNLAPNALFWKQIGNYVFASLDNVNFELAFILPMPTSGGGGGSYFTDNSEKIEQFTNKYYQETNVIDLLIALIQKPANRTEFINNMDTVEKQAFSKKAICQASYALMLGLRSVINDAKAGTLAESPEIQTAKTGGDIAGAGLGIAGLFVGATPIGLALVAGGIAISIGTGLLSQAVLESAPEISDEQLEALACCVYEAMKSGAGDYATFAGAGCDLPDFSWSDFATPEVYAGWLAMVEQGETVGGCPCELCMTAKPANGTIGRGQVVGQSLVTVETNTGGTVYEMQAQVMFEIPLQTITSITVTTQVQSVENTPVNNPQINLSAPSTGGGNTIIPEGAGVTLMNPAHYPLVAVDNFTLTLRVGVCSACTTAQRTNFQQVCYGAIINVEVCGILA